MNEFHLFPPQASAVAGQVDSLYFFLIAVTAFFTLLIFALIVYLGLKYRRRPGIKPKPVATSLRLELTWTIIPFILTMVMFAWGAKVYVTMERPPADAMVMNVIGRQWMWKLQHPEGVREINTLHVPVGRPVKLVMTSQDVIHSFFIPAFRVKQDVVPGRYTTVWFQAIRAGTFHLFCAEYCGAQHSGMIGSVIAMEPAEYQAWLAGTVPDVAPAVAGEKLFYRYSCQTCHGQRAPTLAGIYGRRVQLTDGSTVLADDNYLRESILNPSARIVAGYPSTIMPTFQGQLSEEQLVELIAYIKSLDGASTGDAATGTLPSTQPGLSAPPKP
jgi:cytochrome c oxidase subunit 2